MPKRRMRPSTTCPLRTIHSGVLRKRASTSSRWRMSETSTSSISPCQSMPSDLSCTKLSATQGASGDRPRRWIRVLRKGGGWLLRCLRASTRRRHESFSSAVSDLPESFSARIRKPACARRSPGNRIQAQHTPDENRPGVRACRKQAVCGRMTCPATAALPKK